MNKKIMLTGCYKYTHDQIKSIEALGYDIIFVQNELQELKMDVSNVEVVVCNGLFLHNDIRKFKSLKYLQTTSAGMDRIPLDYLNEHHIIYSNAKGVYSIPISEWVIMYILVIYKSFTQFAFQQIERKWKKNRNLLELTEKKVTIIGYGDVGKEIVKRLIPFGVYIQVVDLVEIKDPFIQKSFLLSDIKEALIESDINILSIALSNKTYKLFDKSLFKILKKDSLLINVARGEIVDEHALIEYLDKLKGVALDVFEKEPLDNNNELWESEKVVITPHNTFVSEKTNDRLFEIIINNLKNWRN